MQTVKKPILQIRGRVTQAFSDWTAELRRLSSLTGAAMLTALGTVLNRFTISFSAVLRLSFAFLTVALSGMLYGPVLTGVMGIVGDLLRYLVVGGGFYFPGFTFNEFLAGFLYGCFLYKKPVTLLRVFLARFTVVVIINLVLTPLWLSILYQDAFIALVSVRIVKNIVMLPIETLLLYALCKRAAVLPLRRAV